MADVDYKPLKITNFQQNMYSWLGVLEGSGPSPYRDSTGYPTVSVGVNLTVPKYLNAYLADVDTNGAFSQSGQEDALGRLLRQNYSSQSAFDNAVKNYDTRYSVSGLPALTSQQAQDLFKLAYTTQYNVLSIRTKNYRHLELQVIRLTISI